MLTWRNVSCAALRNFVDVFFFHVIVFPTLKLYIKGFHFVDVMTREMSYYIVCADEIFLGNCIFFDWHFGKQVMGNLAIIAVKCI